MNAIRRLLPAAFWAAFLVLGASPVAAQSHSDRIGQQLKKRYGHVRPWGKGYILRANAVYAFADSNGRLVLPFDYREMKPVLKDRMLLADFKYHLADAAGQIIYTSDNNPIQLADSAKRRFVLYSGRTEILLSESGRQLTGGFDTAAGQPAMRNLTGAYRNGHWKYGIVARSGDTILPPVYDAVSVGQKLYAGLLGDTLFVWEKDKGLLLKKTSFHDCNILRNDMITVKKFGAWALMDRSGGLLTTFRYHSIQDLLYPWPAMDAAGYTPTPDAVPGYALVNHQPVGLLDARGREVLPLQYESIRMNTNGWAVLRRLMSDRETLADSKFRPVLEAKAYDIGFAGERYVSLRAGYNRQEVRIYDMRKRRFVNEMPEMPEEPKRSIIPKKASGERTPPDTKDTIYINRALTMLHKAGGRWGITSITGDTVLPFVYDTAGSYVYGFYYVGLAGRYAALSPDGSLLTPAALPDVPWHRGKDSLVRTKAGALYSYKGTALRRIKDDEGVDDGSFGTLKGGIYMRENSGRAGGPGIFNRQFKRITENRIYRNDLARLTKTGLVTITDSSGKKIAVIDSAGRLRMPFTPMPKIFVLRDYSALLIRDSGTADILYTFSGRGDSSFSVRVNGAAKEQWISSDAGSWYAHEAILNKTVSFTGTRAGFITSGSGKAVFLNGLNVAYRAEYDHIVAGAPRRWMIYDDEGKPVLRQFYDSIIYAGTRGFLLLKDGKMGAYDRWEKRLYPPVYDSVSYLNSLENHFLHVKTGDSSFFIDENLHPILPAWNVPFRAYGNSFYDGIYGIPAAHDGRKYNLYATAGNALLAVPDDNDLPKEAALIKRLWGGYAILRKGGRIGIYSFTRKAWIVPPRF